MTRNFYVVLGVSSDADPGQIRAAHRRLVKMYHPDVETGSEERFVEVQKAYETLSDDAAKKHYDEESAKQAGIQTPIVKHRHWTDKPLAAHLRCLDEKPLSQSETTLGLFGAIDEFLGGFLPGIFTQGRTASRRKNLSVEIILEPEEAEAGGLFPLRIPVVESCADCVGTGYRGFFLCATCVGKGMIQGFRDAELAIPSMVQDGTETILSLEDIGLAGVNLNISVSVRP